MKNSKRTIFQFKVQLQGIRPPIWRRILVPADITFQRFADAIMQAMGWYGYHLHSFYVPSFGRGALEITDAESVRESMSGNALDEASVKVGRILKSEKDTATFVYDFGDDWTHKITLEKILPEIPGIKYPVCIKGKRNCPPEDCGGVWGYENLLETISNPEDPEYEEMIEWLGGEFDPEEFEPDIPEKEIKKRLKEME